MAWTQSDLDKLNKAIAKGARVVDFDGDRVEYRSLADMQKIKSQMERELSPTTVRSNRRVADFNNGL